MIYATAISAAGIADRGGRRAACLGLQRILEAEGHAVDVTARGEEAVAAASNEKFDLVILDVGLPQMDGFEVLRRLRSSASTRPGRRRCSC